MHRVGEGKRVPIYALKYELDDWWRSSEPLDAGTPPEAHRRLWLRGLAVGGLLAVGTFTLWWLSARKPAPEPRVLPLTSESGMVHSPTFSPDSSQLAFGWKSGNQDKFQLYVRMASGGAPRALTVDGIAGGPAWSPDGGQIAFLRAGSIYLIQPLGPPERKVADGAGTLAWMPDGTSLVISDNQRIPSPHLVSLETGEKRGLTTTPSAPSEMGSYLSPAVSPDGRQVACIRGLRGIGRDIFIIPIINGASSGPPWRLTRDNALVMGLAWTRDGREIVFSSDRGGRRSLWRIAELPCCLTVAARIGMWSGGSGTVEQNVGECQVSEEEGNGSQAGGQHPRMSNQSMILAGFG